MAKFRFFKVPTNGKHFSYLFFWPKVIDNDIYAFKLVFPIRFLSHVFLIYANSEDLGKAI